jgi:hypothetical protein
MRIWNGECQICWMPTCSYTISWYSEKMICMFCSAKEQNEKDIQDVKDADALEYLRRHNLPTENLEKQIIDRKAQEQK